MTTAETQLLSLIGWPVEHSRSPAIHTAALEALGVDAAYLAFAVPPERLAEAIAGLRALGVRGLNVTLPHKQRVMAHLDEIEPQARAIGAVNTILRDGDRLIGANTDGDGLVRSLRERAVVVRGSRAVVLGAGGAARAAVVGLASEGVAEIVVAARRPERAEALVGDLEAAMRAPPEGGLRAIGLSDQGAMQGALQEATLLVQASSATLGGSAEAERFAEALPLDVLPQEAAVVDLVYAPLRTSVLRIADARGLSTVDGLGMLVWQAALALQRWLGRTPPIDVMRRAALGEPRSGGTLGPKLEPGSGPG